MRVKFRLRLDGDGKRITQVFFVSDTGELEFITQMPGWVGLDIDSIGTEAIEKIASSVADRVDESKYIE